MAPFRFLLPVSLRVSIVVMAVVSITLCSVALYLFIDSHCESSSLPASAVSLYQSLALMASRSLSSDVYHIIDVIRGLLKLHASALSVEYGMAPYPTTIIGSKVLSTLLYAHSSISFQVTEEPLAIVCGLPSGENVCLINTIEYTQWWVFKDPANGQNGSVPVSFYGENKDSTLMSVHAKIYSTSSTTTGYPVDDLCLPITGTDVWRFDSGKFSSSVTLGNITCVAHGHSAMLRNSIRTKLNAMAFPYTAFVVDTSDGSLLASSFGTSLVASLEEDEAFGALAGDLLEVFGSWAAVAKGISRVINGKVFASDWFSVEPSPYPWIVFVAQELPAGADMDDVAWWIFPMIINCFPLVLMVILIFWIVRQLNSYADYINVLTDPEAVTFQRTLLFPFLLFSEIAALQDAVRRLAHFLGHPSIRSNAAGPSCAAGLDAKGGACEVECQPKVFYPGSHAGAILPYDPAGQRSLQETCSCGTEDGAGQPQPSLAIIEEIAGANRQDTSAPREWAKAQIEDCDQQLKQIGETIYGWAQEASTNNTSAHLAGTEIDLPSIWNALSNIASEGTTRASSEAFYTELQNRINDTMNQIRRLNMGDTMTSPERRTEATAIVLWTLLQRKKQALFSGSDFAPVTEDFPPHKICTPKAGGLRGLLSKLTHPKPPLPPPPASGLSKPKRAGSSSSVGVMVRPHMPVAPSHPPPAATTNATPIDDSTVEPKSENSLLTTNGKSRASIVDESTSSSKGLATQPETLPAPLLSSAPPPDLFENGPSNPLGGLYSINSMHEHMLGADLSESTELTISDFTILRPLNASENANEQSPSDTHVFLCQLRTSSEVYALKILSKDGLRFKNVQHSIFQDVAVLKSFSHPNIVQIRAVFESPQNMFVVEEYVAGCNCIALLQQRGTLPLGMARSFVAQVAMAVDYLHRQGFVYRNIEPGNVLVDEEVKHIKLIDFTCCQRIPKKEAVDGNLFLDNGAQRSTSGNSLTRCPTSRIHHKAFYIVGTPVWSHLCTESGNAFDFHTTLQDYVAPEQLNGGVCGKEVDFWALGVLLFEFLVGMPFTRNVLLETYAVAGTSVDFLTLFSGVPPFNDDQPHKIFHRIQNFPPSFPTTVPHPAVALICELLQKDPVRRLGTDWSAFTNHAFFHGFCWTSLAFSEPSNTGPISAIKNNNLGFGESEGAMGVHLMASSLMSQTSGSLSSRSSPTRTPPLRPIASPPSLLPTGLISSQHLSRPLPHGMLPPLNYVPSLENSVELPLELQQRSGQ